MAPRKPKAVVEIPVEVTEEVTEGRIFIILEGFEGNFIDYGINGSFSRLPCGVEVEVSEAVYQAVKSHVKKERIA